MNNNLESSKFILRNYFQKLTRNLHIAGIMINGNFENKIVKLCYWAYSAFLLITFAYFYGVTEIIHLFKNMQDMNTLFLTLTYFLAHFMSLSKMATFLMKRKEISNCLKTLEKNEFLPNIYRGGPQEYILVQQAARKLKIQVVVFSSIIVTMLSYTTVSSIVHATEKYTSPNNPNITITIRHLPFVNSYPIDFDDQQSPYYEFVFLHQLISIWILLWYAISIDGIVNGLMIHLTSQFKIVANAFINVTEATNVLLLKKKAICKEANKQILFDKTKHDETMVIDDIQKYDQAFLYYFKRNIKQCIRHHQDTLTLAENFENTFNYMLLIQFLGCLFIYGIQLYQLSLVPIQSAEFFHMTCFIFGMIFQLAIYCWNGNEVSTASDEVANAVYTCNWIPADKATKTLLQMSIMRAERPVYITAGKFCNLSLVTFAAILRGSFSYFTVLRSVNE